MINGKGGRRDVCLCLSVQERPPPDDQRTCVFPFNRPPPVHSPLEKLCARRRRERLTLCVSAEEREKEMCLCASLVHNPVSAQLSPFAKQGFRKVIVCVPRKHFVLFQRSFLVLPPRLCASVCLVVAFFISTRSSLPCPCGLR